MLRSPNPHPFTTAQQPSQIPNKKFQIAKSNQQIVSHKSKIPNKKS